MKTATTSEARDFIASVPWRAVRGVPGGPLNKPPDPHEYVILDWSEVGSAAFHAFVRLIKTTGYKAQYRPPYRDVLMTNRYLEVEGWCYWFIYPKMLNRERAAERKHVPIPE